MSNHYNYYIANVVVFNSIDLSWTPPSHIIACTNVVAYIITYIIVHFDQCTHGNLLEIGPQSSLLIHLSVCPSRCQFWVSGPRRTDGQLPSFRKSPSSVHVRFRAELGDFRHCSSLPSFHKSTSSLHVTVMLPVLHFLWQNRPLSETRRSDPVNCEADSATPLCVHSFVRPSVHSPVCPFVRPDVFAFFLFYFFGFIFSNFSPRLLN